MEGRCTRGWSVGDVATELFGVDDPTCPVDPGPNGDREPEVTGGYCPPSLDSSMPPHVKAKA